MQDTAKEGLKNKKKALVFHIIVSKSKMQATKMQ